MRILPAFLALALLLLPLPCRADRDAILRDYIPDGTVTRFETPVRFWLGGTGRLEGKYYVDTVASELRRIIPHLPIQHVSSMSQANVRVYLTDSAEEWHREVANCAEGSSTCREFAQLIRGFTRVIASPQGSIRRSDVVLHLDFQHSGGQKLWIVRHELMHALGVIGHPVKTTDTVLNSRQPQQDKNGQFSDSDIFVLRTIYDPRLSAGAEL